MPPSFLDGLIGVAREAVSRVKTSKRCPECGAEWTGHYAREHMHYCHHCGTELVEPGEQTDQHEHERVPRL